jgi:hypothetical protein
VRASEKIFECHPDRMTVGPLHELETAAVGVGDPRGSDVGPTWGLYLIRRQRTGHQELACDWEIVDLHGEVVVEPVGDLGLPRQASIANQVPRLTATVPTTS